MVRPRWRAPPSSPLRQTHFPTNTTDTKAEPCSAQKLWSTVLKSSELEIIVNACRDLAERELRLTNPNVSFRHDPGALSLKDDSLWQTRMFALAIEHDHDQDPEHELLVRTLRKLLCARTRAIARERMFENKELGKQEEEEKKPDESLKDMMHRQQDCLNIIDKLVGNVSKELGSAEEEERDTGNIDPLLRNSGQSSIRPPPGFENINANGHGHGHGFSPPSPTHSTSSDDSDMVVETGARTPTPDPESDPEFPTSPPKSLASASDTADTPTSPASPRCHNSPASTHTTSPAPPTKKKFPYDRGQGWTTAFDFADETHIVTAWSEGNTVQHIHDDLIVERGYAAVDPDAGADPQRSDTLLQMLIWFLDARDFWSESRFRALANSKYEGWAETYKLTELLRVQPHMARYAGSIKDFERALRFAGRGARAGRGRRTTRGGEEQSEEGRRFSTALIESRRDIEEWERRYRAKHDEESFDDPMELDADSDSDSDGDDERMGRIEVNQETEADDNSVGRMVFVDF